MTQAHWFSNFCPFFSVQDLESYNSVFGKLSVVDTSSLTALHFHKAAAWLSERENNWRAHLDHIKRIEDEVAQGLYSVFFWGQDYFPQKLGSIFYPPSIIFCRGAINLLDRPTVSIVGSRSPTRLGTLWVQENV